MIKRSHPSLTRLKKLNVAIVTLPLPLHNKAAEIILKKLLKILGSLSNELLVITGNFSNKKNLNKHIYLENIEYDTRTNSILIKIIKYIIAQFQLTNNLIKRIRTIDIVFLVGSTLILPLLYSKILRKKTIILATGSQVKSSNSLFNSSFFPLIIGIFENISYLFSDNIIVYSKSVINFLDLLNYKHKISIANLYVDTSIFQIRKKFKNRKKNVGYIGRFSEEKGIMNFIKSIPIILNKNKEIRFLIGGSGPLFHKIENKVKNIQNNRINLTNWIPYDEIPIHLNELKLIVIPSYTEGLPKIMLEAMACGTPVLATEVGGIPDVLQEGETGFLLKSNDPEDIVERISNLINNPELLEKVSVNAYKFVRGTFGYKKTLETWQRAFRKFQTS